MPYLGRFAPSPTGPLHAGSLVAALASWLDARAHGGQWLVRIEDVDAPRCSPGAAAQILAQLAACGLHPDAPPLWQSQRGTAYQQALDALLAAGLAYPCGCTRRDIAAAQAALGWAHERHVERPYPGTCRHGLQGRSARAWRLATTDLVQKQPLRYAFKPFDASKTIAIDTQGGLHWHDRRLGAQQQNVAAHVGDFVLRRADGLWAYQLAVVVDDAAQGITHIVRGEDLADNTPRQLLLQAALGHPSPSYLHTPLVRGADGEKLSKQHGAPALAVAQPGAALAALQAAAQVLALPAAPPGHGLADALAHWVAAWRAAWGDAGVR